MVMYTILYSYGGNVKETALDFFLFHALSDL